MDESVARAFGIGEGDDENPVERLSRDFLELADGNPSVALRLASGAYMMAEQRAQSRERLVSRGYVRKAIDALDA